MEVRFWAQTDVGRQREHNEDNFLVDKKLNLFIIADGMGGHAAGEVASAAAIHEVRRYLVERQGQLDAYSADPKKGNPLQICGLLEGAVRHACARVHQLAQENPAQRGMGTTIDVLLLHGGRGFIAHVGDSRVYMLRQEKIHQMTVDHSLVNELIRRGRLKPGQAFDSPFKNAVTRAVGVYPSVDVDTMDFDLLASDRFLLCTDGLSGYLDAAPEALRPLLGLGDLQEVARGLVDFANKAGGRDNVTAVVVEAQPQSEEMASLLASELKMKIDALKAIPLLRYLTYRELVKLLSITETAEHEPGAVILREGSPGDALYVLLEGRVRVAKGGTPIADLEAGALFGEMALVDSAPRSATIRGLQACKTLSIPRDKFYDLLRSDSQLAVKLLWAFVQVLTVRLRLSSSELAERLTEQELVEKMTSLFEEPSPRQTLTLLGEPDPATTRALSQPLHPDDVRRAREDSDVVAPPEAFRVLEAEARRCTPVPVSPPAEPASASEEVVGGPTRVDALVPRAPLAPPPAGDEDDDQDTSPGRAVPAPEGGAKP